jgi:hypothetical protein
MKPQHDLRAGEALIRSQHKITDKDGAFWGDVADQLNAAASRFDLVDVTSARIKLSPRETRELNRQVSMACHYMAAHGLNDDGSYTLAGFTALLSGAGLLATDIERCIASARAEGRLEIVVDHRDLGGALLEGWKFALVTEGKGFELLELEHEVPERAGT